MTPIELIGSAHTFIGALHYSLVNTKNIYMVVWMYQQLQIHVRLKKTVLLYWKEKENSYSNFFNSSLSCHQLEPPETMLNRRSWQILKPVTWNGDVWSKISHSTINESALQRTISLGTKRNKTNSVISAFPSNYFEDRERLPQFFALIHVSKSCMLKKKSLILFLEWLWQFVWLRLNAWTWFA